MKGKGEEEGEILRLRPMHIMAVSNGSGHVAMTGCPNYYALKVSSRHSSLCAFAACTRILGAAARAAASHHACRPYFTARSHGADYRSACPDSYRRQVYEGRRTFSFVTRTCSELSGLVQACTGDVGTQ